MHAPMRLLPVMALLAVAACQPQQAVSIQFRAVLGANDAACHGMPDPQMTDLRFYVSDLAARRPNGELVPIAMSRNGRWQGQGLALVDLEDGSDACRNGTRDSNRRIEGTLPAGQFLGLEFTVGVPFRHNHANPLLAEAPLDDSSMHWHWRSGYKFFRAGIRAGEQTITMHLGSAGCRGTVQKITACDFPNRFQVSLQDWQPGSIVVIDLGELHRRAAHTPGPLSCLSAPGDETCAPLMAAFGIDASTGLQRDVQQLFAVQ